MSRWIQKSWVLSGVTFTLLAATAGQAPAAGWGRTVARPLYPAAAATVGVPYATARPVVAGQPVIAAQPVVAGGCTSCATAAVPCNNCAAAYPATTVNFAPRTWYRSQWVRVPVTAYRPVAAVNQVNYAAAAPLQPCNSYYWQVQRVPVRRPLLSWLTWWRRPRVSVYANACAMPVAGCATCAPTTATFAPTASSCANCAPAATTVPAATPYYQAPTTAPANQTPTISPGSNTPADLRPSLRPETQPPIPDAATTRRVNPAVGNGNTTLRTQPYRSRSAPLSDVTPIPAEPPHRSNESASEDRVAPPLLNPRSNTASLRADQNWKVIPVQHAQPVRANRVPAPQRPQPKQWDDSGWRSAR